ncbi:PREDICTED: uncharacterized protein LOC103339924 isoform X2 [Prunus mume]|uniref:Uncharacterized protein LOC103339924 isoform X2 n=1 Tax=Prunus mume TaxID=102107 RepID=A0ABM0PLW8_PRUMU|nr:PREDICTED: uncharacterized protein LOC103339924 isoform X2 [Prunus mume]
MANPGVGTKFVSVNLNKSYGQPSHHPPHPSSYGSNRGRPGSHGSGGMVVLSRPRSANKAGSKLSVPPPLNLPSLRKEHERFDSLGSGGGAAGGGASGSGSRPSSSGVGWTKPTAVALQEKEGAGDHVGADGVDQALHGVDGVSRGNGSGTSVYMPPSARSGSVGPLPTASALSHQPTEKALLLRGEDFPSLQAALPSSSGPSQKQKDGLNQKQRQVVRDELLNEQRDSSHSTLLVDMRPQVQPSRRGMGNGLNESGSESKGLGGNRASEQVRKQDEYFPGPLPLVWLNPRSDWADDERDTSHGFTDRGRDHGFSKTEAYWDRDFDMPRISVLPHKPVHNPSDRRGLHDNEAGKNSSSEVPKVDPYSRDARTPSREGREGNSWRNTNLPKDGISGQVGNERNGFGARPSSVNRETSKENKYSLTTVQENVQDDFVRRDVGYRHGGRQPWNNYTDSYASRGVEWNKRDRYGSEQHNRYRGDALQNSSVSKPSYSLGGKGLPVNDPLLNFGREKRSFSNSEKPYVEDPFMKDFGGTGFDSRDPFSGGLLGVVKKKKDVIKQTDFHDPVRESFEAELERVQKMQEQERQRIVEEQERALELARREEEERMRLAREQVERQRRLEEEAREAAWRAEQEQLEAMRRAEEQRVAREEERRRLFMEEERRKHAAKQKLLELEERIAKRKAETGKAGGNFLADADEKMSRMEKEKDVSKAADMGDWEDGERMVERITASASSDSSLNRSFEMGSRSHYSRDTSAFVDRGKPVNSWRRDVYENGNSSTLLIQDQDNGHHSPRRDLSVGGRGHLRKEFYGGGGFMSSRTYHKGGITEPHMDDITHLRGQRWNLSGDGDHYSRNMEIESEFQDNLVEKFNDVGWGQGRVHGNPYSPYPDQLYPNSDADGSYSFGRSRYSMRQPRVLPPPSLASMHKTSYRGEIDHPGPSAFPENEMEYNRAARSEPTLQTGFDTNRVENIRQPEIIDVKEENSGNEKKKLDGNTTPRCDSQSSLSVSSPPSSPTHLSHDDLDESRDSSVLSAPGDSKDVPLSGQENEPLALPTNSGKENVVNASSSVSTGDDEEWAVESNEHLQEQEEYDEDEDGYDEEDEVHEGDDENIDLTHEFEDMHLEEKGSPDMMDNLVLGFNEGVEVGMPNDEFERSSRNEEGAFMVPQVLSGTVEEHGSFDGIRTDEQTLQHMDGSSLVNVGSSSRIFQETEKAMQNLVIQPNNASHMSATTDRVDHVDAASSSRPSSQHPVASSVSHNSHLLSGQAVMPTVSAVPNQTEGPVKLQFGLFSGPSLIPSPVPAIQIGSIQMPLPLHPQVGPSLAHLHPSQPPLFQFGQLRYTSPISQGLLPMAPQSMSFVQPNLPSSFSLNQTPGGPLPIQTGQGTSQNIKNDVMLLSVDNQPGLTSRHLDVSQENVPEKINSMPAGEKAETYVMVQRGPAVSRIGDSNSRSETVFQADQRHHNSVGKNFSAFFGTRESEGQAQTGAAPSQSVIKEKDFSGPKAHGPASGGRGKKFVFTVKNSGARSFPDTEPTHVESSGFQRRHRRNMQRTEFRVRASADKRQSTGSVSSNHVGLEEKFVSGRGFGPSVRGGPRRVVMSNKPSKQMLDSEGLSPGRNNSQGIESGNRAEKGAGKDASTKSQNILKSGEGNLKRNIHSEEDVYAPLQSGIVRVFEQPGIEAPSDEDDFIEVRSKRQMLNDRREQREREIKAKSRALKVPRKPRSTSKGSTASANSGKSSAATNGEAGNSIHSDFVASEGCGLANIEVSAGFNTNVLSQPLAPIGTPAVKSDVQADIRSQTIRSLNTSSLPVVSGSVKNIGRGSIIENNNKVLDNVQASLSSWGNQQVMALTQTQLDEAMKPGQFGSHGSVGEINSSVCESSMPTSSIMTKEKPFSSAANPINSLLAGEKIQFGAVTSPTILPPSSRAVSHGIGPPGPSRSDMQLSHNLSASENLLFEKEKHTTESCVHLEDCEAEAEAAASAVAVAAISSDEIVGNGLGACSVSVPDTKSFGGADIDGVAEDKAGDQQLASQSRAKQSLSVSLPADLSVETHSLRPPLPGQNNFLITNFIVAALPKSVEGADIDGRTAGDRQLASQSRAEESLSVSLPADLSVETPPISLWPPLPSPQNSSSQMLPHFPGGPPSHFPFYEMNPMLGGPVFAFGPHDESASTTQPQSQKSSAPASAPIGTWQQCHSGVDSFYGPPAGFTGPFISPAGGIPGVQGPPHMVVYNHFAPVGQFGQVGLSFMGTAYIPSGKQPDWKHNPASSAMAVGEGEMNNINMVSAQRNPSNMPAPIQHLAPGSPLLPMASPLAMFDVSPFQSSPDMSRWPHVPASPLQSVPVSMPLQQQADGILPSKFSHGPADQSLPANRFPDSRTSTAFDNSRNFPVATDATVTRFPDELGLVDPASSSSTGASTQSAVTKSSSVSTAVDTAKIDVDQKLSTSVSGHSASSNAKSQSSMHKNNTSNQQYGHSSYYQRGGGSQKNSSGGDWPHRRMGFHGRNQSVGAEKGFPPSKMKQVYVAKQTSSGSSTAL